MGCGKTTVGRRLSYRLKCAMTDTDKVIEKEQDMSISDIFSKYGEPYFRSLETDCLEKLIQIAREQIISVGGGLPLTEANGPLLKELGKVVFLRVKPETVQKRLKGDKTRPLLQGNNPREKIRELLVIRNPIYEECADVVIDVDGLTFEQVLKRIEEAVK